MTDLKQLIDKQANDPNLWVIPMMLQDSRLYEYIQSQLRELHAAVELHLEYCEMGKTDRSKGGFRMNNSQVHIDVIDLVTVIDILDRYKAVVFAMANESKIGYLSDCENYLAHALVYAEKAKELLE